MELTQCIKIGKACIKIWSPGFSGVAQTSRQCIKIWSREPKASQCVKIGNACFKIGMHLLRYRAEAESMY